MTDAVANSECLLGVDFCEKSFSYNKFINNSWLRS